MPRVAPLRARLCLGAGGLSLGCRAEVIDAGLEDPDLCPPCSSDQHGILSGNSCLEWVDCLHRDAKVAYADIGCSEAQEYRWPEHERCRGLDEVCRFDDF